MQLANRLYYPIQCRRFCKYIGQPNFTTRIVIISKAQKSSVSFEFNPRCSCIAIIATYIMHMGGIKLI